MKKHLAAILLSLLTLNAFSQNTTTLPTPTTSIVPPWRIYGSATDSLHQLWGSFGGGWNRVYTATESNARIQSYGDAHYGRLNAGNTWTDFNQFNSNTIFNVTGQNGVQFINSTPAVFANVGGGKTTLVKTDDGLRFTTGTSLQKGILMKDSDIVVEASNDYFLKTSVGNAKYLYPTLGTIYNSSSFVSTSDFVQNGATATVSSGQLLANGSVNNFLNSIDLTAGTLLDTWTITADIVAPTSSTTTYGFAIGTRSTNLDAQYYSVVAKIDLTNGANSGLLSLYNTFGNVLLAASANKLTIAAGDVLEISLYRNLMTYQARIVNKTTPQADVTVTYNAIGGVTLGGIQNTGRFAMFIQTPVAVSSLYVSSSVVKNADAVIIGDSKDAGQQATTYANTYAGKLARNFNIINTGGGSDQSGDVLKRIPEIISLAPKVALLDIGSNDIRYGTALSTTEANISSIYNQLTAAGITTYILTGFYETNANQTALNTWKIATFGANVIDTYTATSYDLGALTGTVHPTSIGEDIAYRTIINANILGNKKNDFQISATDINANVSGTPNQIISSLDPNGFLTFSTPQDIGTASSPTFNSPIFQGVSTTAFTALSLKNNTTRGTSRGVALDLYTPDLGASQLGGRISSVAVGGSSTTGNRLLGSSAINGGLTQGWLLDQYGNFSVQQNATQPTSLFQVTQGATGPGTITVTASGTSVAGVNTQFKNTFKIGQTITANGETHTITAVLNDAALVTDAWTSAASGVGYTLVAANLFQAYGNGNLQFGQYSTAGGIVYTNSTGVLQQTAQPTAGQILLAPNTTSWTPTTVSGDATISTTGVFTLKSTGTAGTYKSVTTDAQGRVTGGTNPTTLASYGITDAVPSSRTLTINGTSLDLTTNRSWTITASPSGTAGGDLTGTYPNPTINTINSITKSYYDPTSSIQTQLNGKAGLSSANAWSASNSFGSYIKGYYNIGASGLPSVVTSGGWLIGNNYSGGGNEVDLFADIGSAGTVGGFNFYGRDASGTVYSLLNINGVSRGITTFGRIIPGQVDVSANSTNLFARYNATTGAFESSTVAQMKSDLGISSDATSQDIGNVAAGTSASFSRTFAGADIGDIVLVTSGGRLSSENYRLSAACYTTGIVTVFFENNSSVDIDPISNDFYIKVLKQ